LRPEHRIVKTFPSANREIPMADPTPTINRTWGSLVVLSSRRRPVCHVSCGKLEQPMCWSSSRSDLGGGSRKERGKSLRDREREREREGDSQEGYNPGNTLYRILVSSVLRNNGLIDCMHTLGSGGVGCQPRNTRYTILGLRASFAGIQRSNPKMPMEN